MTSNSAASTMATNVSTTDVGVLASSAAEGVVGPIGMSAGVGGADGAGAMGSVIPPKRYRIGEVVEFSGFSRQTVHNYTVMGLIRESHWTDGGHRLYDGEVFERLARIRALRLRYPLRDIKRILDSGVDGL